MENLKVSLVQEENAMRQRNDSKEKKLGGKLTTEQKRRIQSKIMGILRTGIHGWDLVL